MLAKIFVFSMKGHRGIGNVTVPLAILCQKVEQYWALAAKYVWQDLSPLNPHNFDVVGRAPPLIGC